MIFSVAAQNKNKVNSDIQVAKRFPKNKKQLSKAIDANALTWHWLCIIERPKFEQSQLERSAM